MGCVVSGEVAGCVGWDGLFCYIVGSCIHLRFVPSFLPSGSVICTQLVP